MFHFIGKGGELGVAVDLRKHSSCAWIYSPCSMRSHEELDRAPLSSEGACQACWSHHRNFSTSIRSRVLRSNWDHSTYLPSRVAEKPVAPGMTYLGTSPIFF